MNTNLWRLKRIKWRINKNYYKEILYSFFDAKRIKFHVINILIKNFSPCGATFESDSQGKSPLYRDFNRDIQIRKI